VIEAEAQGYHAAWLFERTPPELDFAPGIALAAAFLVARTERIRLGALTTLVPTMHPLRLAEEVAMLDIMSRGRFDWAAACGRLEGDATSDEAEEAHQRFIEQLEVARRACSGDSFAHAGEFFSFPELRCLPPSLQRPHPPLWLVADAPPLLDWAARTNCPLLLAPHLSIDQIERNQRARPSANDSLLRYVHVGENTKIAREEAASALLDCCEPWLGGGENKGESASNDRQAFANFLLDQCAIVGDVAHCRARLAELNECTNSDHLIAWHGFGNLAPSAVSKSQRLLIEMVN